MEYAGFLSVRDRTRINALRESDRKYTAQWYKKMSGEDPWQDEANERKMFAQLFAEIGEEISRLLDKAGETEHRRPIPDVLKLHPTCRRATC